MKDLDKSALTLARACEQVINENTADVQLREAIYTLISKERLMESITIVNHLARPKDCQFHDEMVEQYGKVRKFLPQVFNGIIFKAAPAGKKTLEALEYLAGIISSRKKYCNILLWKLLQSHGNVWFLIQRAISQSRVTLYVF